MVEAKISIDVYNEIRTMLDFLVIKGSEFDIVPKELTHDKLLNKMKISESIVNFYYSICNDLLTVEDYNNLVFTGFGGNRETALEPYPICYKGAYINRKQMVKRIEEIIRRKLKIDNKEIIHFTDLFPFLDEYAKGFEYGFNNFENDNVTIYLNRFSNQEDYNLQIIDFLNERTFPNTKWKTNFKLHTTSDDNIIKGYENGKEQGYYYRAWSVIFSQNRLFDKHFSNDFTSENELLPAILHACHELQIDITYYEKDEDTRTAQILRLLSQRYITKDQSRRGTSGTGVSAGSTDGLVISNEKTYLVEALNLQSISRKDIREHINKLEQNYDPLGMKEKYLIVYFNVKDGKFADIVKRFKNYIETANIFKYELLKLEEIETIYTNTRHIKSTHNREGQNVFIHHILLKFPEKKLK